MNKEWGIHVHQHNGWGKREISMKKREKRGKGIKVYNYFIHSKGIGGP